LVFPRRDMCAARVVQLGRSTCHAISVQGASAVLSCSDKNPIRVDGLARAPLSCTGCTGPSKTTSTHWRHQAPTARYSVFYKPPDTRCFTNRPILGALQRPPSRSVPSRARAVPLSSGMKQIRQSRSWLEPFYVGKSLTPFRLLHARSVADLVLNLKTTTSHKCAAAPRRARI